MNVSIVAPAGLSIAPLHGWLITYKATLTMIPIYFLNTISYFYKINHFLIFTQKISESKLLTLIQDIHYNQNQQRSTNIKYYVDGLVSQMSDVS